VFPLVGTIAPNRISKARQKISGGYTVFLDLSGHVGFFRQHDNGFTGYTGAKARLVAAVADRGLTWMPFVGVTVDRQFGFSHTFDIPAQAATLFDTLLISQSNTFWGAELGLDTVFRGSATFGAKTYYLSSADTHTVGGVMFLKIPFWQPVPVVQDSGIRLK
jgi:hypothetical protein